jgi:hypothetical protein
LPHSSNLTRPVDLSPLSLFEDGAAGSPGAGWDACFDFSLFTLPFYAKQELSQAGGLQKRRKVTFAADIVRATTPWPFCRRSTRP